jgi:hypothetical protein
MTVEKLERGLVLQSEIERLKHIVEELEVRIEQTKRGGTKILTIKFSDYTDGLGRNPSSTRISLISEELGQEIAKLMLESYKKELEAIKKEWEEL